MSLCFSVTTNFKHPFFTHFSRLLQIFVREFLTGLPMELFEVPKSGGFVWKRVIDRSLRFSKRLKKISKSIKAKKQKQPAKTNKQSFRDDRNMLKLALEVLETLREFFGPSASYVSIFGNTRLVCFKTIFVS